MAATIAIGTGLLADALVINIGTLRPFARFLTDFLVSCPINQPTDFVHAKQGIGMKTRQEAQFR